MWIDSAQRTATPPLFHAFLAEGKVKTEVGGCTRTYTDQPSHNKIQPDLTGHRWIQLDVIGSRRIYAGGFGCERISADTADIADIADMSVSEKKIPPDLFFIVFRTFYICLDFADIADIPADMCGYPRMQERFFGYARMWPDTAGFVWKPTDAHG